MGVTQKVPVPARTDINTGLDPLTEAFMIEMLGVPGPLTDDCSPVRADLREHMVTDWAGPIRVTGHKVAVESLHKVLTKFALDHPDAAKLLRSAGMLCCRRVRGGDHFSNHSWGLAVDLFFGTLDEMGSETCAAALLILYRYMHDAGWWWAAGFTRRDPMHFEPSRQKVEQWRRLGLL